LAYKFGKDFSKCLQKEKIVITISFYPVLTGDKKFMKKRVVIICVAGLFIITGCKNDDKSAKENSTPATNTGTSRADMDTTHIPEITHRFNNVDPKVAASVKIIVDHYLHIKNSLVNNNGGEAADGGKEMADAMDEVEKSGLTAEQKKIYDDIEDDLKEHAEHIGKNSRKIEHQREHFSMMSEDIYDLVRAFGGGQMLYHDYCPMAVDNKGALWLSEIKEIKNPYFGGQMNECSKITEVIK
jgi:hypothetical protein